MPPHDDYCNICCCTYLCCPTMPDACHAPHAAMPMPMPIETEMSETGNLTSNQAARPCRWFCRPSFACWACPQAQPRYDAHPCAQTLFFLSCFLGFLTGAGNLSFSSDSSVRAHMFGPSPAASLKRQAFRPDSAVPGWPGWIRKRKRLRKALLLVHRMPGTSLRKLPTLTLKGSSGQRQRRQLPYVSRNHHESMNHES